MNEENLFTLHIMYIYQLEYPIQHVAGNNIITHPQIASNEQFSTLTH